MDKNRYLTLEEQLDLGRVIQEKGFQSSEGRDAVGKLITSYQDLLYKKLNDLGFYKDHYLWDDLVALGFDSLFYAARKYNPNYNVKFNTYIGKWFDRSIINKLVKEYSEIRPFKSNKEKLIYFAIKRFEAGKVDELDSDSSEEEIADYFGFSPKDVSKMRAHLYRPFVSLDSTLYDGTSLHEISDFEVSNPEDEIVSLGGFARNHLPELLECLDEREKYIVTRHRLSEEPSTLEELGEHFGITRERARQIEKRALAKIRRVIIRKYPEVVENYL